MENKTLDDLFCEYINSYKARTRLKQSTISTYTNSYTNYIHPYFKNLKLFEIDEFHVMNYTNILLKHYASKTINDILNLLNNILNFAGISIDIYKPKIETKEVKVITDNSLAILINFCSSHFSNINLGILIVIFTGMRIGEICALQWRDIDLDIGIIKINKTMQRIKNTDPKSKFKTKIIIDSPKSNKSKRKIPINNFLLTLLRYLKRKPNAYILTGKSKKFMEPRVLEYHYKKILEELKIDYINFHALRHTFATRFYRETNDTKALAEILGHQNVSTTLNIYVHSDIENKRNLIEKTFFNHDKIS